MKPATVAIVAGVGALAAIYLITRAANAARDTAGDVVSALGVAFNPTSDQNVFYQGANAVTQSITGDRDKTFGVWVWELLNPDKVAAENAMLQNRPPVVGDRAAIGGGSRGFY